MAHASHHLNGHLLAAIDIETTGVIVGKHDILQLCVLPLGPDLKPSKLLMPFNMRFQPKHPEDADQAALAVSKTKLIDAIRFGCDPWSAVDRFGEWFQKLKLPEKKKIVPLGHNFSGIDKPMIMDWLGGPLSYDEFFRSDHRDTMTAALFTNDQAELVSEPIPFPKYNLPYLANILGVSHESAHDALGDCLTTAEVYRRMLSYRQYHKMYLPAGAEITIEHKGETTDVKQDGKLITLNRETPNLTLKVTK